MPPKSKKAILKENGLHNLAKLDTAPPYSPTVYGDVYIEKTINYRRLEGDTDHPKLKEDNDRDGAKKQCQYILADVIDKTKESIKISGDPSFSMKEYDALVDQGLKIGRHAYTTYTKSLMHEYTDVVGSVISLWDRFNLAEDKDALKTDLEGYWLKVMDLYLAMPEDEPNLFAGALSGPPVQGSFK